MGKLKKYLIITSLTCIPFFFYVNANSPLWKSILALVATILFVSIGMFIGHLFLAMFRPDFYGANSTGEYIKQKVFWSIGPQSIGALAGLYFSLIVFNLLGTGHDIKKSQEKKAVEIQKKVQKNDSIVNYYKNLPIKADLSYLFEDETLISQIEKGQIDRNGVVFIGRVLGEIRGSIDSEGVDEFEMDDFESKLQKEFKKSWKNIKAKKKKLLTNIRIIDLGIPVKYKKIKKGFVGIYEIGESVYSREDSMIYKLFHIEKEVNITQLINKALKNDYITENLKKEQKKIYKAEVDNIGYPKLSIQVKGDNTTLNEIGKNNAGEDFIVEMTLERIQDPRFPITLFNHFRITSFKLMSQPDKRFIRYKSKVFLLSNVIEK